MLKIKQLVVAFYGIPLRITGKQPYPGRAVKKPVRRSDAPVFGQYTVFIGAAEFVAHNFSLAMLPEQPEVEFSNINALCFRSLEYAHIA